MNNTKIYIIGGPGSGKTTMARRMAAQHNIPHFDLDEINWTTRNGNFYGQKRDKTERQNMLTHILTDNPHWVIEGVYTGDWTMPILDAADQIIILNTSRWVRFYRILKRFIRRKSGIEKSPHPETFLSLWRLVRWNHGYGRENMRPFLEKIKSKNLQYEIIR